MGRGWSGAGRAMKATRALGGGRGAGGGVTDAECLAELIQVDLPAVVQVHQPEQLPPDSHRGCALIDGDRSTEKVVGGDNPGKRGEAGGGSCKKKERHSTKRKKNDAGTKSKLPN